MTSGSTSERIWQAMRGREAFSASDVARSAGVKTSAVLKRLPGFRRAGLLARAGIAGRPGGGRVPLWRLNPRARACLAPPVRPIPPAPLWKRGDGASG